MLSLDRSATRGPHSVAASVHSGDQSGNLDAAEPPVEPCDALVVGAGPAGLGTALLLGRRKGWERIVIVERRPSLDTEEADKSYVYSIDWRGRTLTDEAGVTDAVAAAGVTTHSIEMVRVPPDGDAKSNSLSIKDNAKPNTWLPRRAFLRALHGGLAEAERSGRVTLLHSTKLTAVHLSPGGGGAGAGAATAAAGHPILVHARDAVSGRERRFAPRLLIGADGVHGEVRTALEGWAAATGLDGERYRPVVLDSPAAGLRYKVLQLPPNPPFRKPPPSSPSSPTTAATAAAAAAAAGGDTAGVGGAGAGGGSAVAGRLENRKFAMLLGAPAPRRRVMRLGLLPIADPAAPRTANFIAPADHEFWALQGGEQLRAFLQASFPQLEISALLTPQQLEAAAAASGGSFPRPQYLRHFTAVLSAPSPSATTATPPAPPGDASGGAAGGGGNVGGGGGDVGGAAAAAATCGVALVGDAVHCFPPDLGQGVNSAMMDVVGLAQALDESGGDLGAALPLYEARRAPEAAALAHLMTFSYPYQYNQAPLRRALWTINFLVRSALSRLLPGAFARHSFLLVQQPGLSYTQIVESAHATTRRLWALAGAVAAAVLAVAARVASAAAGAAVA